MLDVLKFTGMYKFSKIAQITGRRSTFLYNLIKQEVLIYSVYLQNNQCSKKKKKESGTTLLFITVTEITILPITFLHKQCNEEAWFHY